MSVDVEDLDRRNDPGEGDLVTALEAALADDGEAARSHLLAGRPVYYVEENTPKGLIVREHPDGRRDLVRMDPLGELQDAEAP